MYVAAPSESKLTRAACCSRLNSCCQSTYPHWSFLISSMKSVQLVYGPFFLKSSSKEWLALSNHHCSVSSSSALFWILSASSSLHCLWVLKVQKALKARNKQLPSPKTSSILRPNKEHPGKGSLGLPFTQNKIVCIAHNLNTQLCPSWQIPGCWWNIIFWNGGCCQKACAEERVLALIYFLWLLNFSSLLLKLFLKIVWPLGRILTVNNNQALKFLLACTTSNLKGMKFYSTTWNTHITIQTICVPSTQFQHTIRTYLKRLSLDLDHVMA